MDQQFGSGRVEHKSNRQTFIMLLVFIVGVTLVFGLGIFVGRIVLGPKEPAAQEVATLQTPPTIAENTGSANTPLSRDEVLKLQPSRSDATLPATPPELRYSDVPKLPEEQRVEAAEDSAIRAQEVQQQKKEVLDNAKKQVAVVAPTPAPATPARPAATQAPATTSTAATPAATDPNARYRRTLPTGSFTIQIGAFKTEDRALERVQDLLKKRYDAYYTIADLGDKGMWYRVRVGKYDDMAKARQVADEIKEKEKLFPYAVEVKE
ncbi:SPOR domain-containing protein [Chrysiogenes arsenatis]|uniref:SPOR domain-containing protein n=1 Tax=Chrysiogenes arsenatis TaxID=309797 RepID=UPI00041D7EA5|nr:SPOR domain-containing protein [Chrysiogenes arsenatis]